MDTESTAATPDEQAEHQRQLEIYLALQRQQQAEMRADPTRPEHAFPTGAQFTVPNVAWAIGARVVWTHGGLTVDEWREYKRKHKSIGDLANSPLSDDEWTDNLLDLYAEVVWPVLKRSNPDLPDAMESSADVKRLLSPRALRLVGDFLSGQSAP